MDVEEALADDLRAARGEIHFVVEPSSLPQPDEMVQFIDEFVAKHGMTGIGREWEEVVRSVAVRHLTRILHKDLAYDVTIVPLDRAAELAERFIKLLGEACYFTNTVPADRLDDILWAGAMGWTPLTRATFDSGIVAVGPANIGIIWIEDED
jgi:hypothetical protein